MKIRHLLAGAALAAIANMGMIACAQTNFIPSAAVNPEQTNTQNGKPSFDPDREYRRLIEIENKGDLTSIRQIFWKSPSAVFIGKTPSAQVAKLGNWAGFWGDDAIAELEGIVRSNLHITPDYSRVKTVFLAKDVAETYAPIELTVSFAGLDPAPRSLLQIVDWVSTDDGWKIATIIALPIPLVAAK
ncbi:hypothetical protein HNQ77_002467 [Silvibacterium bohemicum]|uniref:SnoaL-like domain-containing protein n=1 Tax=Silvibacterium bohemicum TaxID=1577686 RepID=A0A841JVF5_9BACT|nr:hypothetical protein [Silvibacterium bohemicum]MBB6144515.1 hypothetical protein [Silvibacterium bohemicum]